MKIILFSILFVNLLLSKNIPFGIKDICEPIIKTKEYTSCYLFDTFKWISYSKDISESYSFNFYTSNDKKYDDVKSSGFIPAIIRDTNITIILKQDNIHMINTVKENTIKIVKNMNVKKINTIEGIISSDLNFDIMNKKINIPQYYYFIITDIEKREILRVVLFDLNFDSYKDISIHEIRDLTKINFLFKLRQYSIDN